MQPHQWWEILCAAECSLYSIRKLLRGVSVAILQVIEAKNQAENKLGMIDIAICCAGAANTGKPHPSPF